MAKGGWPDEVPRILWSYHTIPQSITRETPFSLVYGIDAMIPMGILESSQRVRNFTGQSSDEGRRYDLDTVDELREGSQIHSEALKRRVARQHKTKVLLRRFKS